MQLASIWSQASVFAVMLTALQACYAPDPPAGAPCQSDGQCPLGQRCNAGFCRSETALVDAGLEPRDAAQIDGPMTDASRAIACQSSDTCATATVLGAVSGDTGRQSLTARGNRATWLRVRVTEDDNTVAGQPLRVLAKLAPPAGIDFDVILYVNVASDVIECSTRVGTNTTMGSVKQARASWGEDTVANGVDDGRSLTIEIRPAASACASDAMWELSIEGNAE